MIKATLNKTEKLKSKKLITTLFKQGQSFGQYPLRLVYMEVQDRRSTIPILFTVSVSKKHFKKAVQRNLLKRRVREAYRLNKYRLYEALEPFQKQYAFMVLFTGKEETSFTEIEQKMKMAIHRFLKKEHLK